MEKVTFPGELSLLKSYEVLHNDLSCMVPGRARALPRAAGREPLRTERPLIRTMKSNVTHRPLTVAGSGNDRSLRGFPAGRPPLVRNGVLVAIVLACLSCTVHKVKEDLPPPVSVPDAFQEDGEGGSTPLFWWEVFLDPDLDYLEARALTSNFDLRQAWDRLEQAGALARVAAAGQWPEVTFGVGAGRSRTVFSAVQPSRSVEYDNIPITLGAAYEVDIWKRIASLKRGAMLDMEASRQDLDSIAMTLSAQVAEAWFSFIEEGAQLELLRKQRETGRTFLELTLLRFSTGLSSALDVYQQRQQLASTLAQIPLAEGRREVLRHQLAVLVGEASLPSLGPGPGRLADLPPFPEVLL